MSTAIQKHDPSSGQIVALNESGALIAAIAKAASDPNVDVEKMERLFAMHERMELRQAVVAFNEALSEMQVELPSIGERGDAAGRYTFALWEDINKAIKPILKAHGFALTFRTDFTDGIAVTGVLSHRAGHSESTTIKLPADPSGNKNAVQAVASSVSYGKRYTAGALLNLTSHGEDDDAFAAQLPAEDLEWIAKVDKQTDYPKYLEMKKEMVASYGGKAANIPPAVREAFNRAAARTKPKD